MTRRRTYFIRFLLFAVLFHACLSALYFFPLKQMLEKRLSKVFENEHELIDIYFTKSEYATVRYIHSREFVYQGEYFDIKAKTEKNDTVFLKVYPDKREKSIFSHLKNIIDKSDEGSQKKQTSAFFKIFDVFIPLNQSFQINPHSEKQTLYFSSIQKMQTQFASEQNTPPPDLRS
jgi:hypothetical protein